MRIEFDAYKERKKNTMKKTESRHLNEIKDGWGKHAGNED